MTRERSFYDADSDASSPKFVKGAHAMRSAQSDVQSIPLLAVLDAQPWGSVALRRDGLELRVIATSALAQQMLGRPVPIGATLAQLLGGCIAGGDTDGGGERLLPLLEAGADIEIDGAWLWVKLTRVDHLAAYGIHATLALADVTPMRRGLDDRVASLRFLSHDLRSPLNSIVALSQLAESDEALFAQCGGMTRIGELARYALALGEDFLVSSVVAHLHARDFTRFDLRATVRELVPQLEVAARYRQVALQLWLPDGAAVWIKGVRGFAARALQNLVDNAIQASHAGSTVTISCKIVDGFAEIEIRDQAGGLPGLRAKGRVDDFADLPNRAAKSFGLGLKLATQIVKLHQGTLYAEPNDDVGTTFVMRLPCLARAASTDAAASSAARALKKGALR